MRSALADHDAFNDRSALEAGLAFAPIHAQVVLMFPALIDPIEARTVVAEALIKYGSDRLPQPSDLFV
jgi:predicted signal transduction protein with EAL and GGDEF domain